MTSPPSPPLPFCKIRFLPRSIDLSINHQPKLALFFLKKKTTCMKGEFVRLNAYSCVNNASTHARVHVHLHLLIHWLSSSIFLLHRRHRRGDALSLSLSLIIHHFRSALYSTAPHRFMVEFPNQLFPRVYFRRYLRVRVGAHFKSSSRCCMVNAAWKIENGVLQ